MKRSLFYIKDSFWIIFLVVVLSSCVGRGENSTILPHVDTLGSSSPIPNTPVPPSPPQPSSTPAPLAARVNGKEITLAEFHTELALYKAAKGTDLAPEDEKRVLDNLIEETILAQAAVEKGFVVDDVILDEHLKRLIGKTGEEKTLNEWMAAYGYEKGTLETALSRSIGAAWMRDQIIETVPKNTEQVHARQILLYNSDQANEVLAQLDAGNDFGNLAKKFDPITGGDLGWFPRNYLPDPGIEEIAFELQPDEYSPVIQTIAGLHIIQVLERDPQKPLSPDALLTLQTKALEDWLEAHVDESVIEILYTSP